MLFKSKTTTLLILGIICIIVGASRVTQQVNAFSEAHVKTQYDTVYVNTDTFSQANLIKLLKDLHVRFPSIVLAQSILETGHWESKIYKVNNNLFGMREAAARIRTAQGTRYNHAFYKNWKESVYDYAFYQARYMNKAKTKKQYYKALGKSYAESPTYVKNLKRVVLRENLTEYFN